LDFVIRLKAKMTFLENLKNSREFLLGISATVDSRDVALAVAR